jgi:DNA-binding transcriptional regulator YdaS (Cro superfamily)
VIVGAWSKSLTEVIQEATRLRALLTEGRTEEARSEMQGRSTEEKAALVLVGGEGQEDLLSLTGPGGKGYSPAVVDRLPTEALVSLLAVDSEYLRHNIELLRAMSPERFGKAVADTLEPVDHSETRQKVAWEWLEATAELDDVDHRRRLLGRVDVDLVEDALFSIVEQLDLNAVIAPLGLPTRRFRLFSESGAGGSPPSTYIEDLKIGKVLDALWEAEPDLFRQAIRGAWERSDAADEPEENDE